MNTRRRFTTAAIGFVLVVTTGIIGYMTIEGWSFFDSLYMTIITISTVGFGGVTVMELSVGALAVSRALLLVIDPELAEISVVPCTRVVATPAELIVATPVLELAQVTLPVITRWTLSV